MGEIYKCKMTKTITFDLKADSMEEAQYWCDTHDFEDVDRRSTFYDVDYVDKVSETEKSDYIAVDLSKHVVLDRRTKYKSEYGDFVKCCNCGRIMYVDTGLEFCPECEEETLTWQDEESQEVSYNFFDDNEEYVLVDVE